MGCITRALPPKGSHLPEKAKTEPLGNKVFGKRIYYELVRMWPNQSRLKHCSGKRGKSKPSSF